MVKDCRKRGCFQCKGNHHVSIHEERKQRTNVLAPIADVSRYAFSGDCVMPLISFDVKGNMIWGILDTGSTKNWDHSKSSKYAETGNREMEGSHAPNY